MGSPAVPALRLASAGTIVAVTIVGAAAVGAATVSVPVGHGASGTEVGVAVGVCARANPLAAAIDAPTVATTRRAVTVARMRTFVPLTPSRRTGTRFAFALSAIGLLCTSVVHVDYRDAWGRFTEVSLMRRIIRSRLPVLL